MTSKIDIPRDASHRSRPSPGLIQRGKRLAYFFPVLLLAVQAIAGTNHCLAQSSFLSMAPARYIGATQFVSGSVATDFLVGFERAIPVANLLPQVSPDSHVEFLRLIGGLRFSDDGHRELRGRISVVDLGIQKQPWAASFSFLDVNAADVVDLEANWLSLGVGAGVDMGPSSIRFIVRGLLSGALSTSRFGDVTFPNAGPAADNLRHTAIYGANGTLGAVMPNKARLLLNYTLDRYTIDAGIEKLSWRLSGAVYLSKKVQLLASYGEINLTIDQFEDDASMVAFGIHFTPTDTY